jgi:hypothetical protein
MICGPNSANACIDIAPFEIEDIRQADAIFGGKIIRYERVSPGRPNSLDDYGLLTVRVDEVLKGHVRGEVQLYWWNSTFGVPEEEIESSVLIAAVDAKRKMLPLRGASATVFPTRRPDLLQLMQAPCSSPFLLDYTDQTVGNVRKILRGEAVGPHDYFWMRQAAKRKAHALAANKSETRRLVMWLGTALVAVMIAIGSIVAWMRKRT